MAAPITANDFCSLPVFKLKSKPVGGKRLSEAGQGRHFRFFQGGANSFFLTQIKFVPTETKFSRGVGTEDFWQKKNFSHNFFPTETKFSRGG